MPGVEATVWNGFFFPKGPPSPGAKDEQGAAGHDCATDLRKKWKFGLAIVPSEQRTPEYLARILPLEIERWGKVITAAGISID